MATDFWASSHYKRWIVDRATLRQARVEDSRYVDDEEHLDFLAIFFANVITKLGKKLQLRQRVIATATVFFRRFYFKNPYCETDPFFVIPACVYVAAKAEESAVHIKNVISEARSLFSSSYGIKNFPSDNSKLAEMEFYLVDDLECDMVVYHPYKTLLALCRKDTSVSGSSSASSLFGEEGEEGEADEDGKVTGTGIGSEDGPRYWGTGQGQLVLSEAALQAAWSIINDTYRSAELCLLYPPHLIAIAAIYLTFILHPPEKVAKRPQQPSTSDEHKSQAQPRRSSRQASNNSSNINFSTLATVGHSTPSSAFPSSSSLSKFKPPPSLPAKPMTSFAPPASLPPPPPTIPRDSALSSSHSGGSAHQPASNPDPITFLAQLNVSLPLVATIAQEIISLYTLWDRYKEDGPSEAASHGINIPITTLPGARSGSFDASPSGRKGKTARKLGIPISTATQEVVPSSSSVSVASSSMAVDEQASSQGQSPTPAPAPPITTSFLVNLLRQMREACFFDLVLGGEGELLGYPASAAKAAALVGHGARGGAYVVQGDQAHAQGMGTVYGGAQQGQQQQQMGQVGVAPGYAPINKMLERAMNAGYG